MTRIIRQPPIPPPAPPPAPPVLTGADLLRRRTAMRLTVRVLSDILCIDQRHYRAMEAGAIRIPQPGLFELALSYVELSAADIRRDLRDLRRK